MLKNNKKILKLIFVTDIHLQLQNIQKLIKWNKQSNSQQFDFCLVGGDTANCDHNKQSHNQELMLQQANNVLKTLKQIFNCPVIFIPGNHDPLKYYNLSYQISNNIINIHNEGYKLVEGLTIIGMGGSVPGYLDTERTKKQWEGYPFNSDQQVKQLWKKNEYLNKKEQMIILIHCGPMNSSTTVDRKDPQKKIYGGSTSHEQLLKKQNLLFILHGHTHNAGHCDQIGGKLIINPGPLLYGEFMQLQLIHQNQWQLKSYKFLKL